MKHIYIVRHAKSSWDYPELDDSERPLNKRGRRDVPIMGEFLKRKMKCPEQFVSSPAVRAFETAKGIAQQLGYSNSQIVKSSNLYQASLGAWINVIKKINDDSESAMLFGHNPGITALVNRMTNSNIYNIPTCGVAGIKLNVSSWSDVVETKGELDFYYYPKGINK